MSPEEAPRAVAFHPTQPTFFCGFSSGAVRSFSLESAEALVEHRWVPGRACPTDARGGRRPLLPLDTLWASPHLSVWRRCHQGAITSLAASPDGRFLFSACSRGALAQYHSGAPRCRVLRVAGQAPMPSPAWISQYLPDHGTVFHSLTHRPPGQV